MECKATNFQLLVAIKRSTEVHIVAKHYHKITCYCIKIIFFHHCSVVKETTKIYSTNSMLSFLIHYNFLNDLYLKFEV